MLKQKPPFRQTDETDEIGVMAQNLPNFIKNFPRPDYDDDDDDDGVANVPVTPPPAPAPAPFTPAPAPFTPAPAPVTTPETAPRPRQEQPAIMFVNDFLSHEIAILSEIAFAAEKIIQKNDEVEKRYKAYSKAYALAESVEEWKNKFESDDDVRDRMLQEMVEHPPEKTEQAKVTLKEAEQKLEQYHNLNIKLQTMVNHEMLTPCQFLQNLKELLYGIVKKKEQVQTKKIDSEKSAKEQERHLEQINDELIECKESISTFMEVYPFKQLVQCELEKDDLVYLKNLYQDHDAVFKALNKESYDELLEKLRSLQGGKRNKVSKSKRSKLKLKSKKSKLKLKSKKSKLKLKSKKSKLKLKSKKLQRRKNKSRRRMPK
jgi:hypothetical protein